VTSSATALAERRSVPLLALVSIGILLASLMLGLRPTSALAGQPQAPVCLNPLDVVFILDESGSMDTLAGDSTRLGEARDAIHGFIQTLGDNGGVGTGFLHQVGLTTYAGSSASTPLALGGTSEAAALAIVDAIDDDDGNGNTPLGAGMTAGMTSMSGGDRDFVNGVPVTQAFVLLSDGRPWPDTTNDIQRPSSTLIGNYHGTADQSFSILIGVTPQNPPNGAYILDPVLMDKLDNPNAAEFDGNPSDNFFHVQDASELGNIFQGIVNDLLCGDIQVDKTADPTELEAQGGDVTYTYRVSNVGEQGSAPFTFDSASDTLGSEPSDVEGCSPLTRGSDDPGNDDNLLEAGETWVYTCTTFVSVNTQNWGCFTFEYVNSGGATTEDCDDATVVVAEPTPPPPPKEPDIDIVKTNDAGSEPVAPGTEVAYTYDVTNTGNTDLEISDLADLIKGTDVVACDLSDASPDEDAGGDGILSPDETWTFHCSTKLTETTTNEACVEAEVVDLQPTIVAQFVEACSENTVEVSEPGSPTPEGSVGGGTGTPAPSIPNTAISQIGFGGPLASVIFGAILLASLGTLAYANVRSTRERR